MLRRCLSFHRTYPDQHSTRACGHNSCSIHQIQGADQKSPKVLYLDNTMHHAGRVPERMSLQDSVSAHPRKTALFMRETRLCRRSAVAGINANDPGGLRDGLVGLSAAKGLGKGSPTSGWMY